MSPFANEFAELAFFVDGADGAVEHVEADDNADGEFARALGDGDDVGVFAGDGGEDAASEAWGAAHAFAYDGEQADVFVHFDRTQVAVRQLKRQVRF